MSNNGARVRLLLYWKGLESAFRVENPSALGGLKSEAYLALNPQGKMPLLVVPSDDADESLAIPESEVIAQYVLHAYADVGPALIPEDPKQRALAALVTRVHDVYIAPIQGCLYRGPMPISKRAEDLAAVAKQMDVVERVFADAARFSEKKNGNDGPGPFVCGAKPCFADAALFPTYVFLERILPRLHGRRPRTAANENGFRAMLTIGAPCWRDKSRARRLARRREMGENRGARGGEGRHVHVEVLMID